MDYQSHYNRLMERARSRELKGYCERHHVIPRCLGGTNIKDNLVRLTPEEHYVAHQLLVKMHPGNTKLLWAASGMAAAGKNVRRSNKLYGWLRRKLAESLRGKKRPAEIGRKVSQAKKGIAPQRPGYTHTAETKEKMAAAARGKPKSLAHRKALSDARRGKKLAPHSEEWKQHQREAMGSPEYKIRQSIRMREAWTARKADPAYRSTADALAFQIWGIKENN